MEKDARIYVAGHRGLVGSALTRRLQAGGWRNIIHRTHAELDLQCEDKVNALFAAEKPHYVFVAAARVGGIHANNSYPVDFLLSNLRVQNSVIDAAWRHGVKGLLFLGSSCIYPKLAPQPLKEEYLLSGPLEPTNEAYAIAKIAGIKLCESFNRQYGTRFVSVMPTNLYGPSDNYDLLNSHVLPALIRKFHLARLAAAGNRHGIARDEQVFGIIPPDFSCRLNAIAAANGHAPVTASEHVTVASPAVVLWGTGSPRREFLYSDDLADACILLMCRLEVIFSATPAAGSSAGLAEGQPHLFNIGCGVDHTIREMAELVRSIVGFDGAVHWDAGKPDGTPRKLLDIGKISNFGWRPNTSLDAGIRLAYRDYLQRSVG